MYRTETQSVQQRVVHHAKRTSSSTVFKLLTGENLFEHVEDLSPKQRERLYPPAETLSMFISQVLSADGSCQEAVNNASINRVVDGLEPSSTNTGSYCKARSRLDMEMIKKLAQKTGQLVAREASDAWLWKNRRILLVDGMTVTLPDTEENQKSYPQPSNQKPGLGFPICRIVALTDLSSGALIDAEIGPCKGKGSDEQSMLRAMLDRVNPGDILVGDAFYSTYFLLCDLKRRGIDGVFSQLGARRRVSNFNAGVKLGRQDHLIALKKSKIRPEWMTQEAYDEAPSTLTIRELKKGKGEAIVTTLLSPKEASKNQIIELYNDRWNVELDIRNIKTTMGMEILRCKTPEMAMKELWTYLLAYNLIRIMMVQSALLADKIPRQLSFKHALQILNILQHKYEIYDGRYMYEILMLTGEQLVGLRPGRIEPRALKRRMKAYPLLMVPRDVAQAQVRLHGHPKKQR